MSGAAERVDMTQQKSLPFEILRGEHPLAAISRAERTLLASLPKGATRVDVPPVPAGCYGILLSSGVRVISQHLIQTDTDGYRVDVWYQVSE